LPGDFTTASAGPGRRRRSTTGRTPTPVYGTCDEVALGALQASGRQVPGDIAVAGFDDIPAAEFSGLG